MPGTRSACLGLETVSFLHRAASDAASIVQGTLAIGAAVLSAQHVLGIDVDPAALATAQANVDDFDELPVRCRTDRDRRT